MHSHLRFSAESSLSPAGGFTIPTRDLKAEVAAIQAWLLDHPSLSPNAISLEAGYSRNSLTNLMREQDPEKPTEKRLDNLYGALQRYGFQPQGPGLPTALSSQFCAQLLHLLDLGYSLKRLDGQGWVIVEWPAAGAAEQVLRIVARGATPDLALVGAIELLPPGSSFK